jgi:nitric oxide reductase subunit B
VIAGQGAFLRNGLMEYGSIFGHGAYLRPDYTADYLHNAALSVLNSYGGAGSRDAALATIADLKSNRYDASSDTLTYSAAQAQAFEELREGYGRFFSEPTTKYGLRPNAIADPEDIRRLTAFFSWSAWASAATRPGKPYSYTNNWPPEPLVDNRVTADAVVWERAFSYRAVRRHRPAAGCLRPLELLGLARTRTAIDLLPRRRVACD